MEGPSLQSAYSVTLNLSAVKDNRQDLQSQLTAPGRELVNFTPSLPNHLSAGAMPCHLLLISEGWKAVSVNV